MTKDPLLGLLCSERYCIAELVKVVDSKPLARVLGGRGILEERLESMKDWAMDVIEDTTMSDEHRELQKEYLEREIARNGSNGRLVAIMAEPYLELEKGKNGDFRGRPDLVCMRYVGKGRFVLCIAEVLKSWNGEQDGKLLERILEKTIKYARASHSVNGCNGYPRISDELVLVTDFEPDPQALKSKQHYLYKKSNVAWIKQRLETMKQFGTVRYRKRKNGLNITLVPSDFIYGIAIGEVLDNGVRFQFRKC
jgi:hypothetical protein